MILFQKFKSKNKTHILAFSSWFFLVHIAFRQHWIPSVSLSIRLQSLLVYRQHMLLERSLPAETVSANLANVPIIPRMSLLVNGQLLWTFVILRTQITLVFAFIGMIERVSSQIPFGCKLATTLCTLKNSVFAMTLHMSALIRYAQRFLAYITSEHRFD